MKEKTKEKPNKYTDIKVWEHTNLCCMGCTAKMVFECLNSEVDYGGGNLHKCLQCGFEFYGYVHVPESPDILLGSLGLKAFDDT